MTTIEYAIWNLRRRGWLKPTGPDSAIFVDTSGKPGRGNAASYAEACEFLRAALGTHEEGRSVTTEGVEWDDADIDPRGWEIVSVIRDDSGNPIRMVTFEPSDEDLGVRWEDAEPAA